jgi:hypothetical protein
VPVGRGLGRATGGSRGAGGRAFGLGICKGARVKGILPPVLCGGASPLGGQPPKEGAGRGEWRGRTWPARFAAGGEFFPCGWVANPNPTTHRLLDGSYHSG